MLEELTSLLQAFTGGMALHIASGDIVVALWISEVFDGYEVAMRRHTRLRFIASVLV